MKGRSGGDLRKGQRAAGGRVRRPCRCQKVAAQNLTESAGPAHTDSINYPASSTSLTLTGTSSHRSPTNLHANGDPELHPARWRWVIEGARPFQGAEDCAMPLSRHPSDRPLPPTPSRPCPCCTARWCTLSAASSMTCTR